MMNRSGADLSLKYERKSLFLGLKMATFRAMKANRGRVVFREFYSLGQSKVPKFSISTDVVDFFYVNFFKFFRCMCCMLL